MAFKYLTSRAPEYISSTVKKRGEISQRATVSSQGFYFSLFKIASG